MRDRTKCSASIWVGLIHPKSTRPASLVLFKRRFRWDNAPVRFPDPQSEKPLSPDYDAAEPLDANGNEVPLYPHLPEGEAARWPRTEAGNVDSGKKREASSGNSSSGAQRASRGAPKPLVRAD